MRFIKKDPVWPNQGDKKVKKWFALWPVTIDKETRWLERVKVEFIWDDGYGSWIDPEWIPMRFVD